MKEINIDGRILKYQLMCDCDEYGTWEWTEFYEGTEIVTKTVRSGWFDLFGTRVQVEKPKLIFTIEMSCDDDRITKEEWRKRILRELSLLNRREELERGELI
jgi:hypothetical protein